MTNCFSLSDYVIKASRRHHFMQIFSEIIFEEFPWSIKRKWPHMSPNSEKINGTTFAPLLCRAHAKRYCTVCTSAIPRNSTIFHSSLLEIAFKVFNLYSRRFIKQFCRKLNLSLNAAMLTSQHSCNGFLEQ